MRFVPLLTPWAVVKGRFRNCEWNHYARYGPEVPCVFPSEKEAELSCNKSNCGNILRDWMAQGESNVLQVIDPAMGTKSFESLVVWIVTSQVFFFGFFFKPKAKLHLTEHRVSATIEPQKCLSILCHLST